MVQLPTAIMYGHIPSLSNILAVREELIHEVLQTKASLLEDTGFPVLCKYNVFR